MGVFQRILGRPAPAEKRAAGINLNDPRIWEVVFKSWQKDTASGIAVDAERALDFSPVYNAVTIISQSVGSLPLPVYRRLDGDGKERARSHPLYPVLHRKPNPLMSPMTFWETALVHLLLHGNFYAEKEYDEYMNVRALWPLPANRVEPVTFSKDGDIKQGIFYKITRASGTQYNMADYDVFHVPGLGFNGIRGYSVITKAREAIGLGLAVEKFGSLLFANNVRPGIAIKLPGELSETAEQRLKDSFAEVHGGLDNAHKPLFLEEGMDIQTFSISPEDAQFLETRKFQVSEIARWFNLPPHKIKDLERATFSNIEQQNLDYVIDTVRPWCVRIEQAITNQLFKDEEADEYFAEFLMDALLRGDSAARGAYYREMVYAGAMSPNEVRAKENFNPVSGLSIYSLPVNMAAVAGPDMEDVTAPAPDKDEPPPDDGDETNSYPAPVREEFRWQFGPARKKVRDSYKRVVSDTTKRIVRGERREVMKAVRKYGNDPDGLASWIERYYRDKGEAYVNKELSGPLFSLAEAIQPLAADQVGFDTDITADVQAAVKEHAEKAAYRYAAQSRNRLVELAKNPQRSLTRQDDDEWDIESEFEAEFDSWEETRPRAVSDWETVRIDGLVAKTIWALAGITALVWVAGASACEFCQQMNGAVVGIDEPFLSENDSVESGGKSLSPSWNVASPPLHDSCECSIEPEL